MKMRVHIVKKNPQAESTELDHYQAVQRLAEMHHFFLQLNTTVHGLKRMTMYVKSVTIINRSRFS